MRQHASLAAAVLLVVAAARAGAENPPAFDALHVGVDAEGFITLAVGLTPPQRFFPLGTFFYPAPPGETDEPGGVDLDYHKFAVMGGNLVVAPWVPDDWPNRPGAVFKGQPSCGTHLSAAGSHGVKIIADPAPFWGKAGVWGDDGAEVSNADRQTWFNEMVGWVEDSTEADAFMGYYAWDQPAWRYYDSRTRLGTPRPSAAYIAAAAAHVKTLDAGENADHATYMVQGDAVKVRDLWPDYHAAADIVGACVLPFPAPNSLHGDNEMFGSAKAGCLLPNYNASVTGGLEDAVYEAARYATAGGPRVKPYVAVLQGMNRGTSMITEADLRFQAYDAVIHGAKGLVWYDDNGGVAFQQGDYFYKDVLGSLRSLMMELSSPEMMGVLKGDYDDVLMAVTAYHVVGVMPDEPCEESTLVGGRLVPRAHFLSDRIIVEAIAKKYDGQTYLVVACRAPAATEGFFRVYFRPYFSACSYEEPWGYGGDPEHMVFKLGPGAGWMPLAEGPGGGWWEDDLYPETVAVYKFQSPAPKQ